MIPHNLFTAVDITRLNAPVGSGSAAVTTTGVDMNGFDGVMFLGGFGTGNAGHVVKAVSGTSSGSAALTSDIAANVLTGPGATSGSGADAWSKAYAATSSLTTAGSENTFAIDVVRPLKQYVGVTVTPADNTTIETIWALRYRAASEPVINNDGSTVKGIVAQQVA